MKNVRQVKMVKTSHSRYIRLLNVLLFSGLGCFSYLLLALYSDLPKRDDLDFSSLSFMIGVMLVFNAMGFCLILIDSWLKRGFLFFVERRRRVFLYYAGLGISLLLMNYLLFVGLKWMAYVDRLFYIRWSGIRLLLLVWLVEMVIVGLTAANNFYRHTIVLYKRNIYLKESSVEAQYQALQSQLNPHFLFNSLNTLISEIGYNPENAILFTQNLSDVYRYILQCQQQRLVTLGSELEFLDSYVFLHRVRLGDCITVDCRLDESLLEYRLPPLTLQLLAENVIKHNIISLRQPMVLSLSSEDENWLVVSNSVRPKKSVQPSGMGLKNLASRYRLVCGQEIIIEKTTELFTVKIPLLYE